MQGWPVHESVLDAVGGTPLVRLTRVTAGIGPTIYAKLEFANPAGSVKDRAALAMVRAAERLGDLPAGGGGVIVEGTSGNTGAGLAMVGAQRGHRTVVVVPNSIAREKVALLRAYGAAVVETPATLPREHPEHVVNLAKRIAAETPGGWYADQYDNPANPRAHELTTGPEIWEQTGGRVTHLVAGIGTGGTITGLGRYLKSRGPVTVVAADPLTSRYSGGDGSPYYVEAVGHYLNPDTVTDVWPRVYDPAVVDRFERIGDRESLLTARRLAREEGLLVGGSSGTAVAAALRVAAGLPADAVVVVVLPDSGRNYLTKYFDDAWMVQRGFLDAPDGPRVRDVIGTGGVPADGVVAVPAGTPVADVPAAGLVAVVTARDTVDRSAPEVLGVVEPARLRGLPPGDDVAAHAGAAPPGVGDGENAAEAHARVPDGPVMVLVDGRAVALVDRATLRA